MKKTDKKQVFASQLVFLSILFAAFLFPVSALASDFIINEIRIDQPSTDNDEYFEISGTPGASLDGITYIVIGDGAGGSGVIECVVDLTGNVIPGSGYFVAAESTFSLGSADMTADLNFENGDNVTHMLVEGFTGTNGMDLDIDDDGVFDSISWTELIDSVALIESVGSGDLTYSPIKVGPDGAFVPTHVFLCADGWQIGDFTLSIDDTPGTYNNCPVTYYGNVIIDEILQNPSAVPDSAGEWFELYNISGADIDINGWAIADNDTDYHVIDNGGPLIIPAYGYLVLGVNGDTATNGGVDVDYVYDPTWFLSNGSDEIVLYDYFLNEIDRVEYDNGVTFPDPNGATMSLIDPKLDNNIGANWCEASTPYGDGDRGTPGAANDCLTVNNPPDADAGGTYYVDEGGTVQLDASGTTDPEQAPDTLIYEWDLDNDGIFDDATGITTDFSAVDMDGPGVMTVGLRVSDDEGATDVDSATVNIINVPPIADAGADQIVSRGETVTVTGSWTDPAGALDEPYVWAWDIDGDGTYDTSGSALYGDTISVDTSFDQTGLYTLKFQIVDKDGGESSDTLTVEVINQPPDCVDAYPSKDILWPPNHKFEAVDILGVTDPEGDPVTITIDSITQDEPEDSFGDGSFAPDSRGVGSSTAELRAERNGSGDGREYVIRFTATDDFGGECSGEVIVTVPKSIRKIRH